MVAPSIDSGSVSAVGSTATVTAPAFSSGGSNRVILIAASATQSGASAPTVSSISCGGLSFARKSGPLTLTGLTNFSGGGTGTVTTELWWAPAPSTIGSITPSVTWTSAPGLSGSLGFSVWSIAGCDIISSPWDTDPSLPAFLATTSLPATISFTTTPQGSQSVSDKNAPPNNVGQFYIAENLIGGGSWFTFIIDTNVSLGGSGTGLVPPGWFNLISWAGFSTNGPFPGISTNLFLKSLPPSASCGLATANSITFNWLPSPGTPGPDTYTLWYRPTGTTTWTVITGLTTTSYLVYPVPASTTYDFRVEAIYQGIELGFTATYECASTSPTPPSAVAPTGSCGAPTYFSVTFQWSPDPANPNPDSYTLEYRQLGTNVWTVITGITDTDYTVPASQGETFEWQVQAVYGGVPTAFSTIHDCTASIQFTLAQQGVLGDYRNGNLYVFNPENLTDNGVQRRWLRSWRALEQPREQTTRFSRLRVDLESGTVLTPAGTNPHCVLRWSDDGGHSWSNERIRSMGRTGETAAPVKFSRLGSTRRFSRHDRVFELSGSDLAKVAITGADVDVS